METPKFKSLRGPETHGVILGKRALSSQSNLKRLCIKVARGTALSFLRGKNRIEI